MTRILDDPPDLDEADRADRAYEQAVRQPTRVSDWARLHGTKHDSPWIGDGVTWLDPQFPSMDASTFEPVKPRRGVFIRPEAQAMDQLFYSESIQSHAFAGLHTYEAAVLGGGAAYGMDPKIAETFGTFDEDDSDMDSDDDIDEDKWLAWKKDTWLVDYAAIEEDGNLHLWSVNSDQIWRQLRKAINLANTILHHALDSKWLPIFAHLETTEALEDVQIPKGNANRLETIWRMKDVPDGQIPSRESTIEQIKHVASRLSIAFAGDQAVNDGPRRVDGCTCVIRERDATRDRPGDVFHPTFINVWYLRTLLKPDVQSSTRKMIRYQLAVTLLHEFMHALNHNLMMVNDVRQLLPPISSWEGPNQKFTLGMNVVEEGFSFEQYFFGGRVLSDLEPLGRPGTVDVATAGSAVVIVAVDWPPLNPEMWENQSYGIDYVEEPATQYPVPASGYRSFDSPDFWKLVVAKYGMDALKMPRIVTLSDRPKWTSSEESPDHYRPLMRRLGRLLHRDNLQWARWRPWYFEGMRRWGATPCGNEIFRFFLQSMMDISLVRRLPMDEAEIQYICGQWLYPYAWPASHVLLPGCQEPDDEGELQGGGWFWRGLGMLVAAAVPAHPSPVQVLTRLSPTRNPWSLRPCSASDDMRDEKKGTLTDHLQSTSEGLAPQQASRRVLHYPDEAFNPSYAADIRKYRGHLLDQAFRFFKRYECASTVNLNGMRQAWIAAYQQLRAQVDDFSNPGPSQANYWLAFHFKLPQYEDDDTEDPSGLVMSDLFGGQQTAADYARGVPVHGEMDESQLPRWVHQVPFDQLPIYTPAEVHDRQASEQQKENPVVVIPLGRNIRDPLMAPSENSADNLATSHARRLNLELHEWKQVCSFMNKDPKDEAYFRSCTGKAFEGLSVNSKIIDELRKTTFRPHPVGRVLRLMRAEDVWLNSGHKWIRILDNVYDVSSRRSVMGSGLNEGHQRLSVLYDLLIQNAGRDPSRRLAEESFDVHVVAEALKPFRIGVLANSVAPQALNRAFTLQEILRRKYRDDLGMYIAIRGKVYDITRYSDFHPGFNILQQHAGTNVTDLFEKYHPHRTDNLIKQMNYLCVGYLVSQHEPESSVPEGCIRLRGDVYDLSRLPVAQGVSLPDMNQFSTWDLTLVCSSKSVRWMRVLAHLRDHPEAIVSRAERPLKETVPCMTRDTLGAFDGENARDAQEPRFNKAFVAVGEWVYDVTSCYRFGPKEQQDLLKPMLGCMIDQKEGDWITKELPGFITARLVETLDTSRPRATWNPRMTRPTPPALSRSLHTLAAPLPERLPYAPDVRPLQEPTMVTADELFSEKSSDIEDVVMQMAVDGTEWGEIQSSLELQREDSDYDSVSRYSESVSGRASDHTGNTTIGTTPMSGATPVTRPDSPDFLDIYQPSGHPKGGEAPAGGAGDDSSMYLQVPRGLPRSRPPVIEFDDGDEDPPWLQADEDVAMEDAIYDDADDREPDEMNFEFTPTVPLDVEDPNRSRRGSPVRRALATVFQRDRERRERTARAPRSGEDRGDGGDTASSSAGMKRLLPGQEDTGARKRRKND